MTNVLVLNGSPRGDKGNTNVLSEAFLKGMRQADGGIKVKTYLCNKMSVSNCTGCFGCWNKTPGVCIFKDDMPALLKDYLAADVILYVTPLYYYGMTALLKKVIERLLPLNKPYMVKEDGKYTHSKRYDEKKHKHILISTCGFPERHNFRSMIDHCDVLAGGKLDESILCTGGELLTMTELAEVTGGYIGAATKAGYEFLSSGKISAETATELEKGFVGTEAFVDMANMYWNVPGDNPPPAEIVHGRSVASPIEYAAKEPSDFSTMGMREYIEEMGKTFKPSAAKNMKSILQFDFTDSGETYQLAVGDGRCVFSEGSPVPATTTIRVSTDIWKKIGQGTLNGASALMQGLYSVQGDFGIMMKMSEIFSDKKEDVKEKPVTKKGFLSFIPGLIWLSVISFIPWYVFWFTVGVNPLLSTGAALIGSCLIMAYRKAYLDITPFDTGNVVFFALMLIWQFVDPVRYAANAGLISSLGMAAIWLASLMTKAPLTSWYSKDSYSDEITVSSAFEKINSIITVFWVLIYLSQAAVRVMLPENFGIVKLIVVYGLLFVAGFFTAKFPDSYMTAMASGNKKEKKS